jgi:hypothetical protein
MNMPGLVTYHQVTHIAVDLFQKLRRTPLLLGWLIAGPVIAFLLRGPLGLVEGIVNIALLGMWAVIIRWMTSNSPEPLPVRRPRLELVVALVLLAGLFIIQLLDFGVVHVEPLSSGVRGTISGLQQFIFQLADVGVPKWALQDLFLAASSTVKQLIPVMLVSWLLGYNGRGMGLQPCCWRLTAVLLMLTLLLGLASGTLWRAPLLGTPTVDAG